MRKAAFTIALLLLSPVLVASVADAAADAQGFSDLVKPLLRPYCFASYAGTPLIARDRVIGILGICLDYDIDGWVCHQISLVMLFLPTCRVSPRAGLPPRLVRSA